MQAVRSWCDNECHTAIPSNDKPVRRRWLERSFELKKRAIVNQGIGLRTNAMTGTFAVVSTTSWLQQAANWSKLATAPIQWRLQRFRKLSLLSKLIWCFGWLLSLVAKFKPNDRPVSVPENRSHDGIPIVTEESSHLNKFWKFWNIFWTERGLWTSRQTATSEQTEGERDLVEPANVTTWTCGQVSPKDRLQGRKITFEENGEVFSKPGEDRRKVTLSHFLTSSECGTVHLLFTTNHSLSFNSVA